jgi:ribonuclease T2
VFAAALAAIALLLSPVEARESRGAAAGDFDLYLLALSWSPGFCASGGDAKAPDQCAAGTGFGFVVHGLWPQYTQGYPSYCEPQGRMPQRRDLEVVRGVMPSEGLARYEWRKHGTCSGLAPSAYFSAVARVAAGIVIPDVYQNATQDQTVRPLDVERAFSAVNNGLRPDMMTVACTKDDAGRSVLQEVRLCLSKDLRGFSVCPDDVQRDMCRSGSLVVPRPR